jgi:hypothetical protein
MKTSWFVLTIYYLGYKIKEDEMGGACGMYGGVKGACRVSVGKPEGHVPRVRPRRI